MPSMSNILHSCIYLYSCYIYLNKSHSYIFFLFIFLSLNSIYIFMYVVLFVVLQLHATANSLYVKTHLAIKSYSDSDSSKLFHKSSGPCFPSCQVLQMYP